MRGRIAASVVLAAALLVGTAGCNLIAPQATTIHYDPSDGVGANVGSVHIRNAMIITDDGETGSLVFTVINDEEVAKNVTVQWGEGSSKRDATVKAAVGATPVGTADSDERVVIDDLGAQPGALFPVYFQYDQNPGEQVQVPVLDGTLPEYQALLP